MSQYTSTVPLLKDSLPPALPAFQDGAKSSSSLLDHVQQRRYAIRSRANPSGRKSWQPFQFWTPVLVVALCLCAVAILEVVLYYNKKAYGWKVPASIKRIKNFHVLLTAVPAFFSRILVQHIVGMDRNIKIIQPYVDMTRGRATATRSVLLDYSQQSNILILPQIIQNGHVTAFISSILCLISIALSPLSSSYIFSQAPPQAYRMPLRGIQIQEQLGIPSSLDVSKLDAAAGFMKAASSFSLTPPPFVRFNPSSSWTAARFNLSSPLNEAGTIFVSIPCIKSFANCSNVDSVTYNASTSIISGNNQNLSCSFQTRASDSEGFADSPLPFGIAQTTCQGITNSFENPVVFWVLKNVGGASDPQPLATVCQASIMVQNGMASLNGSTLGLLSVLSSGPLDPRPGSVNLGSPPFNGTSFNGLFPSNATATDLDRKTLNSTVYSLGKAVAMLLGTNTDFLTPTASVVYAHYLGMVASTLYFTPLKNSTIDGNLNPIEDRLFISALVTHVLAVLFFLVAIGGVLILLLQWRDKRDLRLGAPPGTIASAIAIAGQSELSYILEGMDTMEEMETLLSDLTFRIDSSGRLQVEESCASGYMELPYH